MPTTAPRLLTSAAIAAALVGCTNSSRVDNAAEVQSWTIDSAEEWQATVASTTGMTLADGYATAQQATASLSTIIATSAEPRRLSKVVVEQSQVWDNWETIPDVTPAGLRNAYVFLPVKPGDYYLLAMPPGSNVPYPAGMSEKEKRTF
ncbi:MAG: hypothetical protein ACYTF0_06815, partial [Planctomycetota bacterium]